MVSRQRPVSCRRSPQAPAPRLHALVVALAAAGLAQSAWAQSVPVTTLPTGGQVVRGTATISTGGSTTNPSMAINQSSNRAVLNWGTFSIGRDARVDHTTPGRDAITLHRVVGIGNGPTTSFIDGTMTSNGRVFLVNTSGVVFGSTAQVNVGALAASTRDLGGPTGATLDARLDAFMTGSQVTLDSGTGQAGVFVDFGARLVAQPDGSIVLHGVGNATSAGTLTAERGNIALVAAGSATLDIGSSGFVRLVASSTPSTTLIDGTPQAGVQGGTASAAGGTVQIIARGTEGANGTDALAFVQDGTVLAEGSGGRSGRIELLASGTGSRAEIGNAYLDASTLDSSTRGGDIVVNAQNIRIGGFAQPSFVGSAVRQGAAFAPQPGFANTLRADGVAGGGSIRIGEERAAPRGPGEELARSIFIDSDSFIGADATGSGNGGSIAIVSTFDQAGVPPQARTSFGVLEMYGSLSARGGTSAGNGGSIETSAPSLATSLTFAGFTQRGAVDASARAAGGQAGLWTIDPYNVTISALSPTANVNGQFEPTGPGATISATDIGNALNNGTSVAVTTGAGGSDAGNITVAGGTAISRTAGTARTSLTLRAHNDVVLQAGSAITSSAGALDLSLLSDLDASGAGRVDSNGATIATRGGNVAVSGGIDPATGFAAGASFGARLQGGSIDTRGTGVAGDVTIRGQLPASGASGGGSGVVLFGTRIDANNIRLVGNAAGGSGVSLTNTTLATTAGAIEVRGVSTRDASTPVFAQSVGVDIGSNVDLLGGAGSVTIAGRADDSVGGGLSNVAAVGVQINDLQITGTQTSTGRVTLAGESLGSTGAGIAVANPNAGLEIRENGNANLRTGAGVVIGASAGPGASNALDLGSGFRPRVLSGGGVNFRPLGVDTNGNIVERAATPIEVGVPSSAQGTNFLVNPAWLAPASATSGGFDAPRIVIGSSAHQGSITVQSGALANTGNTAIALQNAATGSGGITLAGPVGSATLDLSLASAGNVTQSGALTASQLTITGTPTSSVTLTDAANQIAGLSFDGVPSIDVFSSGSLRIGSATANGFDSATSQFAAATVSANRAGQRAALSSAGDLTVGASITMTGANPVLDLRAANDVIIEPFIAIGSTGGAAQMSFTGDSDASGQGRVLIEGQSASVPSDSPPRASALNPPSVTIDSAGGNITISGRAGSSAAPTAVSIRNARVAAGAGTVSIDGRSSAFGTGVRIDDTSLSGAGVTIGGTGTLAGVNLINTDVTSGAQGMDIRGTANGSAFGAGVLLDGVVDLSTGTGPLTIAGTQRDGSPGSAGLQLGSVNIRTADGAGGTITIFGEASGTSGSGGAGMVRDLQLSGLSIGGTSANAASGANVIIGGNTANGPMFGDGMSDGVLIRTTGNVNVRPLIQVGDQIRSNDSPIAIRIAAGTGGGSSAPVGFVVPNEWLVGVNGSRGIAAAGVVVGADAHRGDIAVGAATLGGAGAPPIGLGTSGSIAFEADAGNSALNLSLSAGGNVTQAGNLTAAQLAIVSGNSADVALTSAGNRIGRLSFDGLSVFSLNTLGNLTIDAGTAVRYGPGGFATTSILGSRGGVWLLLRSQDGDVVMNRSISMLAGAASQVNLVAAERFRNNNGSTIDFVGGGGGGPDLWRVWSRTWEGTSRAPMDAPNLYGCAFGGNGLCANTQTPVPTTTNLFIYADRPTLNVTANGQSLRVGTAPGPLTYTVTGLVNGDVQDEALTGALASTAAAGSPAGSYAITQGSLASPLGYNIVYTGASVNITTGSSGGGSGQAIDIDPKAFQSARSTRFFDDQRTDVYGSNSPSRPQICIGSSAIRGVVAEGTDVEPLVIEWVRVRGQPKLSGCLTVRNEESCAAF